MATQITPLSIAGGCLCEAVRYTITFPADHDFAKATSTCQCVMCRKQTGALFARMHRIPKSAISYSPTSEASIKHYSASEGITRSFCGTCGSVLAWCEDSSPRMAVTVGSFDEDALKLHGHLLTYSTHHIWCKDEIKGVTDHLPGSKYELDDDEEITGQRA